MKEFDTQLLITPETKIDVLLGKYPQLEALLISMSPDYKTLYNPALRKTGGKTEMVRLSQVAIMGGFKVIQMVNILRREVGQEELPIDSG
ncbi:MAG: DUF1858 domain-containing protein [bacterium]|nr:DUF1858 domain-containing protein [bacterium]